MNSENPLIQVSDISKKFIKRADFAAKLASKIGANVKEEVVHAVDRVSFSINKGEVVGLVGESGCGKSTMGRMIASIIKPTNGDIHFHGQNIAEMTSREAKKASLKIQMIFQDPLSSLNPRMRIESIIGEAPRVHRLVSRSGFGSFLDDIMQRCGLDPSFRRRYPHQFSGGQRQRIGIARALAVSPDLIVCDESVSGLDVSIQAQILNLFMELRDQLGLTYLFISHDIGVVEHISDRVMVMYLGRLVEIADTSNLFSIATHPYTKALLKEVPRLDKRAIDYKPVSGEIPSPLNPPQGCHFHPRCPNVKDDCRVKVPQLCEISKNHGVACHDFQSQTQEVK